MKRTSMTDGQERFGPDYRSYDYFVMQHATAENDPRGDQAHLGQHFVLWHRVFLLTFEKALLAVDPAIGALPYWDMREGLNVIFGSGERSFGSTTGTGPNSTVADGAFANWTVSPFDVDLAARHGVVDLFEGVFATFEGQTVLRKSAVPSLSLVRYPKCGDFAGPPQYSAEDYELCTNQSSQAEWYWCAETGNGLHELTHFWIGSAFGDYGFLCPWFAPPNFTKTLQGDFIDKSTSPNDPIFFLHHAFVDMSHMDFMSRNGGCTEDYCGFQAASHNVDGTHLKQEVNSQWPFLGSDLLPQASGAPMGPLKYWEVMCWVGPETAPYTYDVLAYPDTAYTNGGERPRLAASVSMLGAATSAALAFSVA